MAVTQMFLWMGVLHIGKTTMQALYKFYDVVLINSDRKALAEINGQKGSILGMAENDQGDWSYSVHVLKTEECWDLMESELEATGESMKREDFYDGGSVTVEVDAATGSRPGYTPYDR